MSSQITFNDFKSDVEFYKQQVENISQEHLTFLWLDEYYDGMLSGVLQYNNQKFRFQIITDYTQGIYPRLFAIIELSDKKIEQEIYWNELFKKFVGNHNSLAEQSDTFILPSSEWHYFYDQYNNRTNNDYARNIVKGWFIEK